MLMAVLYVMLVGCKWLLLLSIYLGKPKLIAAVPLQESWLWHLPHSDAKSQMIQHLPCALPYTHLPHICIDDAIVADNVCPNLVFLHATHQRQTLGHLRGLATCADGAVEGDETWQQLRLQYLCEDFHCYLPLAALLANGNHTSAQIGMSQVHDNFQNEDQVRFQSLRKHPHMIQTCFLGQLIPGPFQKERLTQVLFNVTTSALICIVSKISRAICQSPATWRNNGNHIQ